MAQYVVLIRAADDPDPIADNKRDTPEYKAIRERWGVSPHLTIKKLPPEQIEAALLDALAKLEPCTFNRVAVGAFTLTADVISIERLMDIWWGLVERGVIEHTSRAPILWRRVRK